MVGVLLIMTLQPLLPLIEKFEMVNVLNIKTELAGEILYFKIMLQVIDLGVSFIKMQAGKNYKAPELPIKKLQT